MNPIADRDQWLASIRDFALVTRDIYEAFRRADFGHAEAMEFTILFLESGNHDAFHRREM